MKIKKHHCLDCQSFRNLIPYPLPSSIYRICPLCLRVRQGRQKMDPVGYKKALESFTGPAK